MSPTTRVPEGATINRDASSFSGPEVAALVGISYRQLDYWTRHNLIRASVAEARGSGSNRRYSRSDVAVCRLVARLVGITGDRQVSTDRFAFARSIVPIARDAIESGRIDLMLVITETGDVFLADTADELLALVHLHQVVHVVAGFDMPAAPDRDSTPVAAGVERTTSDGVSTVAAAVG